MEVPVLRLGFAGFTPEQESTILTVVRGSNTAQWDSSPLLDADAWMINGARGQVLDDGELRVAPGAPGGRSVRLRLQEVSRPVAIALPLPARLEAPTTFDSEDAASIARTFAEFEQLMQYTKAQLWLGSSIVAHQAKLLGAYFELRTREKLVAMLDMRGHAAVLATATQADFVHARWRLANRDDAKLPEQFCHAPLETLMWQYCLRTSRDILPSRYRSGLIYFRRPPRIERRSIADEHLLLMRELALGPSTFDDLKLRIGISDQLLARVLGALYFVGSITSNSQRAGESTGGRLTSSHVASAGPSPDGPEVDASPSTAPLLN